MSAPWQDTRARTGVAGLVRSRWQGCLLVLATALLATPAAAISLNVEHDAANDTLVLRAAGTGSVVATSAPGCCAVVADGVTAHSTGNRLYVLDSSGVQVHLRTFRLDNLGAVHDVALPAGVAYSALRFNPADGLLYALAADRSAGSLSLVALNPATGASNAIGVASTNCCLIVPGSAALGPDVGMLLAVTRALDDPTLQLSAWNLSSGARTTYPIAAGRHIDALTRDTDAGQWLMLYRDNGGAQTLAGLTLPGTVTPLATLADCCMSLAGPAVPASAGPGLRFVGRSDLSTGLRSYRFGADGTIQVGAALSSSLGLVRNNQLSDLIFADGFEGLLRLAGQDGASTAFTSGPWIPGTLLVQSAATARPVDEPAPASTSAASGNTHLGKQDRPMASRTRVAAVPVPARSALALLLLALGLCGVVFAQGRRGRG